MLQIAHLLITKTIAAKLIRRISQDSEQMSVSNLFSSLSKFSLQLLISEQGNLIMPVCFHVSISMIKLWRTNDASEMSAVCDVLHNMFLAAL